MNVHPIFIHFPIALLSLYTFVEILRFKKITQQPSWFYIKAVLVIAGTLGALLAVFAGDSAVEAVKNGAVITQVPDIMSVIHLHELLAQTATAIFGIIAVAYVVAWLNKFNFVARLPGKFLKQLWQSGTKMQNIITDTPLVIIMAILGAVILTIAAGLGGAMIYGPDSDPVVNIVYHFFF